MKIYVEIIILYCISSVCIAQSNQAYLIAQRAYERKEYNTALENINKAIYADNSNTDYKLLRIDIYSAQGKYTKAIEEADKLINQSPSNFYALERKINALFLIDNIKTASELIEKAIDHFPMELELYYFRGLLNNAKEKYLKALNDFNKAEDIDNNEYLYKVYVNRGATYFNLQEYENALDDFNRAIKLDENNQIAYYSRAMANYELKNYENAVEDFTKSIEMSEENDIVLYNLGMSYFRLEVADKACYYFNKSCTQGNKNACKMLLLECTENF